MSERIELLTGLGQSLWYDNIQRRLLENGELESMIQRGEIRGVTSNPSIFKNAIANSNDYDSALIPLAWAGWKPEDIFWQLAVEDIQAACDMFLPLYQETDGGDGYVSLEVSPYLAMETQATVAQVKELWERVERPNLMVKIPATTAGIPAIREAIAAGINVNVTLIFSLTRYAAVMEAYLSGLEARVAENLPIDRIASVASFFISRVDSKVDTALPKGSELRGQAAIANARLAYQAFLSTFSGSRWEKLGAQNARVQRPLWASTSTKNPDYPDTLYVDTLIGPQTVNTLPPGTLDAFRDHGKVEETLAQDLEAAMALFAKLEGEGVAMEVVTQELEDEGVKAFADAFTALLETIQERCAKAGSELGPLAVSVSKRIAQLDSSSVPRRIWDGDPTLWASDAAGQAEVRKRLGWLRLPESSLALVPEVTALAENVWADGIQRVLLIGMGGSSLAPEVLSLVFEDVARIKFAILDSTDPAQVAQAGVDFPSDESLYVISSKSGGTAEVLAGLEYFWEKSGGQGSRFVAVTDAGSALEKIGRERAFRAVINADPEVGGRYSALTAFGLVPAALMGIDLKRLLGRAAWLMAQSGPEDVAARNPGLVLGAVIAEAAKAGRDKLTVLADPPLASFGSWMEQLIAESSGKDDQGIVPVDLEPLGTPADYGADRTFVYLRQTGELDRETGDLRESGHPVLEISVPERYDLGAEFYRWEFATAIACHILGVNAFDQPNVEHAKDRARAQIAAFQENGTLGAGEFIPLSEAAVPLKAFLAGAGPGDYVALAAFLPRNEGTLSELSELRVVIRKRTKSAVTLGFGPRFLHSTGQLHKGGANNGLFLQITSDPTEDFEIPTQGMSFGTLALAQALGEYEALQARGRRVLRVHLSKVDELKKLVKLVQ